EGEGSIHTSRWPIANEALISDEAEAAGELLIEIATAVRRYKSESNISLGTELQRLQLVTKEAGIARMLEEARADIMSVTRARQIEVSKQIDSSMEAIQSEGTVQVTLKRIEA
ncbi:MAG TPA: class I tRNA ligase family protein, partial [Ktedonobacteraceae bacterium]|nr:class I tRNA ligase family protein [Ktedonobacteraceae bacterium]